MKRFPIPRESIAVLATLLLSAPSAIGVQKALEPTRGSIASWLAAAGFELTYLATALLQLRPELRTFAQRVALSAVATAIMLNTLADYAARVPNGLANGTAFLAHFDALALSLALVESAPLAGLAYALSTLLHRLAEQDAPATTQEQELVSAPPDALPALVLARMSEAHEATRHEAVQANTEARTATPYACPSCGVALSAGQFGAAKRYGHCQACRA